MLSNYQTLGEHANWTHDAALLSRLPHDLQNLIMDTGSLTAALTSLSNNTFKVELLEQSVGQPYLHEQRALGRPRDNAAMVRQVELHIHNTPMVFARSVVPLQLVNNEASGLAKLGEKPLGHLLFKDGNMRVSKREYAQISMDATIYARRTPYEYQGNTILVAEFFLPALEAYLNPR